MYEMMNLYQDLSHGKENVPVPCVNYYDEALPEFCSYNTARTPTNGVPLNLDPDFLCGCDCADDCVVRYLLCPDDLPELTPRRILL